MTVSVSTRAAGRPKTVDYVVERGVSDLAAWTLPVDLPSLDQDTGVVTVELEFHAEAGGTGATVSGAVKSNTLGLVRGISGEPLCVLACDKTEECWSRKETLRGAVVSVPSGTTSLAIDDTAVELAGVPGWAYAFLPARRTVALKCSAGSQSSSAVLYREGSGMVMLLR